MTSYVGLLRAVNLGSHNQVAMPTLRDVLGGLGLTDCRTLLQSGNVVFRSTRRKPAELEALLAEAVERRFKVATDFFVRTSEEWRDIISGNPFPTEAKTDPGYLHVMVLKAAPSGSAWDTLRAAHSGPEVVRAGGRHAYIFYPNGIGRSRLTNAVIEKRLSTRCTGRNWNTVLKLHALACPEP